jgi:hypothetical protein
MKLTILAKHVRTFLLVASGLCLAACTALTPLTPAVSPSPAASETPTPTIVWFPATDTPTVPPAQPATPTVDYRPGLGAQLFADDFTDPALWNTASSGLASSVVARNRLILSISSQGVSIASLRSLPELDDFYAEATVDLSLCRGKDQYGMLFRAAPGENFYRFAVNCAGQVRLERSRNASLTTLQNWLNSGDAPQGGPAVVKLGVWAVGSEMRFFLNDNFQFSAQDRYFRTGMLGFYAASGGTTSVLAAFSDLAAYTVSYVPPPPTATASRTPKP